MVFLTYGFALHRLCCHKDDWKERMVAIFIATIMKCSFSVSCFFFVTLLIADCSKKIAMMRIRLVPFGSGLLPLSSVPSLEQLENTVASMLHKNGGILGDVSFFPFRVSLYVATLFSLINNFYPDVNKDYESKCTKSLQRMGKSALRTSGTTGPKVAASKQIVATTANPSSESAYCRIRKRATRPI